MYQMHDLIRIYQDNKRYILLFISIWLLALFIQISLEKGAMVIFFSANRNIFLDFIFINVSRFEEGLNYLLASFSFLILSIPHLITLGILLLLVLSTTVMLKGYFEHERPYYYFNNILESPELVQFVEGVEINMSSDTSFPSGHTISSFAFYFFVLFFVKSKGLKTICFIMPFLVGISRIYLAQHFLKDVLAGMLIGFVIAYGCTLISMNLTKPKAV